MPINRHLALRGRATTAIDGPRGQSSSDLILAFSYKLSPSISLAAGYRWADEKILPGRNGDFGIDLNGKGPLLGLLIRVRAH